MRAWSLLGFLVTLLFAPPAPALPRFAARNSLRCLQCHINPSGGGIRNRYGAEVFAATLAIEDEPPEGWVEVPADTTALNPFSGTITDWLWIGADLRAAFFLAAPEGNPETRPEPRVTSSFFVMQADLYHAARLGRHTTLVLDIGVNSGFEAWGLFAPWPDLEDIEVLLKVGRFTPALGIRTANHTLYTRQDVGLGAGQQDTGVELTVDGRRVALTLGFTNGSLGARRDGRPEARGFDKAFHVRGSFRWTRDRAGAEFGGYVGYNVNTTEAAGLFDLDEESGAGGLDELRTGAFVMAGLGRFALLGDFVFVQDDFREADQQDRHGYAAYVELSMHVFRYWDLLTGLELQDPDLDHSSDHRQRWSIASELFVWRYTELRVMGRYEHGPGLEAPIRDLVAFVHLYF